MAHRGLDGRPAGRCGRVILALETSCDDTCAAVVDREGRHVLSNVISSQGAFHDRYGGVVPEVASRHHLELVNTVVEAALEQAEVRLDGVDSVAVTRGPGLIGALLVGLSTAKALAAAGRRDFVPVDHLHAHVAASFLEPDPVEPPFLCLIASGGHTLLAIVRERDSYEVVGTTLDDAAGEAFDKGARLLGLGYPGGAALERLAAGGDAGAYDFPVGMRSDPSLDFSFSGLKTALAYRVRDLGPAETERRRADLAASYQRAICDSLVARTDRALDAHPSERLVLGGGVAANGELRRRMEELAGRRGARLKVPPAEYCTDNAAMIGAAAAHLERIPYPDYLAFDAFARAPAGRPAGA